MRAPLSQSAVRVRLVGIPRVEVHGSPAPFATRKALALLVYLLLERGRHPRERLAALLFPESDAEHARAALRTTLAYLRVALGAEAIRVHADRVSIEIAADGIELDLEPSATHDGFLDGLALDDAPEFEEWLMLQREHWRRGVREQLWAVAQRALASGDSRAAIDRAARCLDLDPLDEATVQLLLRAHLADGDAMGAWRCYVQFEAAVRREVGGEPGDETRRLAERARSALSVSVDRQSPMAAFDAAFVGRARERLLLGDALDDLANGPRVIVVEGEPGIGKTRLCHQFVKAAMERGTDVLVGHAVSPLAESAVPYQALIEALRRRVEAENAPADLLADTWLAELGRLLPELLDRYPDLAAPSNDEGARARLLESIARLVHALAERAPLVFQIDDVQWLDAASIHVMRYCVARWHELGSRVLVLLTLRDDAAPGWLLELERSVSVQRLELGPLSAEEAMAWIGPGPGGDAFARWLLAETGGNPFFLGETLRMLLESGALSAQRHADGGTSLDFASAMARETELRGILPPRVRDLVRTRLARLDESARAVLMAAAVLESATSLETVGSLTEIDTSTTLGTLEGLVRGRWLLEEPAAAPMYRFAHDKIREAVYADLSLARRQLLHRRAFALLRDAGALPAELARHAVGARLRDATVEYAIAAGAQALAVFATREAIHWFNIARDHLSDADGDLLRPLFDQLGRAHELASDAPAAERAYRELLTRAHDDPSLACLALNRLATVAAQTTMDVPAAFGYLRQAEAAAVRSGQTRDRAETAWNLAQVAYYARDLAAARGAAAEALLLARKLGDADLLGRALNVSAYVLGDLDELAPALAYADEAIGLYRAHGNKALEADCLAMSGGVLVALGEHRRGAERARMAVEMCDALGNGWGQVFGRYHLGLALAEAGELDAALGFLAEAQRLGARGDVASPLLMGLVRNAIGMLHRTLGAFDLAIEAHRAIAEQGFSLGELCADYACIGDWAEAAFYARLMLGGVELAPSYARLRTLWFEVEALVRAGDRVSAERTLAAFGTCDSPRYRITRLRAEAALTHESASLRQALDLAQALALPIERAEIEHALRQS